MVLSPERKAVELETDVVLRAWGGNGKRFVETQSDLIPADDMNVALEPFTPRDTMWLDEDTVTYKNTRAFFGQARYWKAREGEY